jgi:hypothetical protein
MLRRRLLVVELPKLTGPKLQQIAEKLEFLAGPDDSVYCAYAADRPDRALAAAANRLVLDWSL